VVVIAGALVSVGMAVVGMALGHGRNP